MEIDNEDIFTDAGSYIATTTKTIDSFSEITKPSSYFGDKKDELEDLSLQAPKIKIKSTKDTENEDDEEEIAEEDIVTTKRLHTVIQAQGPTLPSDVDMDAYPEPEEYPNTDEQYTETEEKPTQTPTSTEKINIIKIEESEKLSLLEERARGLTTVFKRDDNALRREKIDPTMKDKIMDPRYVTSGSYEECYPGVYETAQYKRAGKDGAPVVYSSSSDDEDSEEYSEEEDTKQKLLQSIVDSQPQPFQLKERGYIEGSRNRKRKGREGREKEKKGPDGKKSKTKPKSESQKLNEELTKINNYLKKEKGMEIIEKKK